MESGKSTWKYEKEDTGKNDKDFKGFETKLYIFKWFVRLIFILAILFIIIFECGITSYHFSFSDGHFIKID